MKVQELYDNACKLHRAKNYDATLKILDEIKRRDPTFKRAYYLEAWTWELLDDSDKKFQALEKILPLLDFSTPEEKNFAEEILQRIYLAACEQYNKKNYDAALKILDEIKRHAPKFKQAYHLESLIWSNRSNSVKEYYALEKILLLLNFSTPDEKNFAALVLSDMGYTCAKLALSKESEKFYRLMLKATDSPQIEWLDNALFYGNTFEDASLDYFYALYAEYKKILADIKPFPKKFYDHKKIRVGFLSGGFNGHVVVYWSRSLLTRLDKNFFTTYFYSNNKVNDHITEQLRASADGWREIFDLTDADAARLIRDDEIDILFDLDGHTSGNRLRVAAYRPASVQMSGVGYMGSTGLDCFDYFLSDKTCAGNENYFVEELIKLPHTHACYEPPSELEPAAYPPCVKNNFVTFGTFNQFHKITESMLRAWKKILDAVPDSHLLLKNQILGTDDGQIFVGERLKDLGFDLGRVELRGLSTDWLAQYADVDIALDTFPYTGGVTTCDALYMGVPVVSLFGERHGSRFGLSILKNIGLEELAVASYDEYIKRVVMLAGDWELLTLLRKNLRPMMKKSPLMDSELYLREIQAAFRKILDEQKNLYANE